MPEEALPHENAGREAIPRTGLVYPAPYGPPARALELARQIVRHALHDAGISKAEQAEHLVFAIENLVAIMIAIDEKG